MSGAFDAPDVKPRRRETQMTTGYSEYSRKASGWLGFAGIMLILAGAMDVVDGIWAIGAQDTAFDTIIWDGNLDAWGWFYLILGIALIAVGFGVFQRAQWAVWGGIAAASVGAVMHMFWVFTYPIASLVLVTLNVLVIYALSVYGADDAA
jgi:hypothetical protein